MLSQLFRAQQQASSPPEARHCTSPDQHGDSREHVMRQANGIGSSSHGPSLLESLPLELFLQIISYCHDDSSQKALYALSLTNRKLNRLVTPTLYEIYRSSRYYYKYVRTLVTSPELAARVKTLCWKLGLRDPDARSYPNEVASKMDDYKLPFTMKLASIIRGGWREQCGEVLPSYLCVALMHTPNVERLFVRDHTHWPKTNNWQQVLTSKTPNCFSALKSVCILSPMRLELVVDLFQLPNLESLRLGKLFDSMETEWPSPEATSNIQNLELYYCYLHPSNVAAMIRSCQKLKTFSYSCPANYSDKRTYRRESDIPKVKTALDMHAESLREVHFRRRRFDRTSDGQVDTFAFYDKLTALSIPAHSLDFSHFSKLAEQLPRSLKELYLDGSIKEPLTPSDIQTLALFPKSVKDVFPNFHTLHVENEMSGCLPSPVWHNCQAEFVEHGLVLKWWCKRYPGLAYHEQWQGMMITMGES